jgi:SNF2 family DNA or RNA helicase
MMQISRFKWVPQKGAAEKVKELLSPSIRFPIEDVWDGPELVTKTRAVELTATQTKMIRDITSGFVMELKSGLKVTAVNEAAVRTKILQVAQGAVYDADHKWHAVDAEPRKREFLSIVENSPGKILCFIPLTSVIRMVYGWLKDYKREIINGQTSQGERTSIIKSFQEDADGCRIILADPGSLSLGVNLFAGRTVCWYGPTDKTEQYLQGCKRVHRPGQRFPVSVVRLVATDLEREIYRRLEANESLQGVVLKMIEEGRV